MVSLVCLLFRNKDFNLFCSDVSTVSDEECIKRGCLVDHAQAKGVPRCYLDPAAVGYSISKTNTRTNGLDSQLVLKTASHKATHFQQIAKLDLSINYLSENILRIKITDADKKRYEVPIQSTFNFPKGSPSTTKYTVNLTDGFNLTVTRANSHVKMLVSIGFVCN